MTGKGWRRQRTSTHLMKKAIPALNGIREKSAVQQFPG
jgi:hypothetical protein